MPPRTSRQQIDPDAEAQQNEKEERSPVLPSSSGNTVTVACRLPNGHILELCRMEERDETSPLGTRTVKTGVKTGEQIKLNGCATPYGVVPGHTVHAGYGLTTNVPKDFWDEWCRQNKDSDLLKNRIIFANENQDKIFGQARDQSREKIADASKTSGFVRGVPSGLEAIDRKNLPRVGLGMRITTAGEKSPND